MKRLICLLLTLLLVACLPLTAWATQTNELGVQQAQEESKVLAAYRMGDSLYSFVRFEGGVPSEKAVKLAYDQDGATEQLAVASVKSCALNAPVRLVLLVSNSIAMKDKTDTLLVFARELMRSGPKNLSVTVATQAQSFQLVAEDVTDADQLMDVLSSITYESYTNNIMSGVASALNTCFDEDTYQQGRMQNLLVFTNGATNLDWEDRLYGINLAEAAMKKSPEVLIHSVMVEDKSVEERTRLEKTNGAHLLLTENQTMETAAAFAQFLNAVHTVTVTDPAVRTLELSGLSLKYSYNNGGDFVLHDVPLGVVADLTTGEIVGTPVETVPSEPQETAPATPEAVPGETEPAGTEEIAPTGTEEVDPTGTEEVDPTGTEETDPTGTEETEVPGEAAAGSEGSQDVEPKRKNTVLWLCVGIGGAVLIALVVVTLLLLRRKNTGGIAMRLVVEYGNVPNIRQWYTLKDSFYLGSGRGCDVVIPESLVDKKNTRIYLDNGQIFVEDLGSRAGTLLGGMKLHGPNRLRSGDVVTVGNTSIRFLF